MKKNLKRFLNMSIILLPVVICVLVAISWPDRGMDGLATAVLLVLIARALSVALVGLILMRVVVYISERRT